MVAKHDLKKKHHGRRKLGQKKRRQAWLRRNKIRFKNTINRKARRRNWLRARNFRRNRRWI